MAGTILVRDMLWRASTQLTDTAPQFTRYTQFELVTWLNDAQRAIAKLMPSACARMDAIKLKAGARQTVDVIAAADVLPEDGSTATSAVHGNAIQDVICLMGADGLTRGNALHLFDREVLDRVVPGWAAQSGSPRQYAVDGRNPKVFWLSPGIAAGATLWALVSYLSDPATIPTSGDYSWTGSDTTKLSVDDVNSDDVLNYILARAMLKDAEYAAGASLAQGYSQAFINSMNSRVAAATGVNPNLQTLPNAPSTPA